jgi:hypothetical protein
MTSKKMDGHTAGPRHTPGDWGVEDPMGPEVLSIVANPDAPTHAWVIIASVHGDEEDGLYVQQKANAHLLAAAPDLLRAAQDALAMHAANLTLAGETVEALRRAIRKATVGSP